MPRKLIQFHAETLIALEDLAGDRMATFQELADEAFGDLLRKHGRPVGLKQSLKASAREGQGKREAKGRKSGRARSARK